LAGVSSVQHPRHVALLRGINVGGHHKLPMATLRQLFVDAGASEVETYIQSGNVVFAAPAKLAAGLAARVEAAILAELGFTAPIVLRSGPALAKLAAAHPFADRVSEDKLLMVGFCERKPSKAKLASFDPATRSPGDFAEVRGSEVFLAYPDGSARSKLDSAWLDRSLGVMVTTRNWRTVAKLAALAHPPA
jgi:uncharacterized protein (DUF1697 family)